MSLLADLAVERFAAHGDPACRAAGGRDYRQLDDMRVTLLVRTPLLRACCAALGERSRGQGHQEAIALVRTVRPHGVQMARDLERLIQKNNAHYGMISTTGAEAAAMIAWAQRLITSAARSSPDDSALRRRQHRDG